MVIYLVSHLASSVPGVGILGGIVGGSATLARNLKARKGGEEISNSDMAKDTAKEAAGSGVATALGIYAWDRLAEGVENGDRGTLFSGKS